MDLEKLKNRDYVLVLDKSGSMEEKDTPDGKSRWESARESVQAVANRIAEYDPDGINLITFAGTFKEYPNTTPAKVADVFRENSPMGGTTLGPVLKHVFDSYTARKKAGQAKANGELLIVVTDGQPSDEGSVASAIVNFTKTLDSGDDEYGIAMLQVGRDPGATRFLKKLDDDLTAQGAKWDIVDTKTMEELENVGLTEALIAALSD